MRLSRPPARIVFLANLWTLGEHPLSGDEWSLERKIEEVRLAGFHAVNWFAEQPVIELLAKHKLRFSGMFNFPEERDFENLLQAQLDCCAETVNVQLGQHDTPLDESIHLTLKLMEIAERKRVNLHLETHRGTCTETPEKALAIADAYHQATGKLLRMNFDFSHIAVLKHLAPADFSKRLITRPDLLQNGNLIHCRPFNGHHCQVPVTDGRGQLTPELKDYLPFVEDVFRCWLDGPRPFNELWVVPELGPVSSGYGISTWPAPWEDAIVLKHELQTVWDRVLGEVTGKSRK
jgi:hypothetical protein